jgi:hypothetical protein
MIVGTKVESMAFPWAIVIVAMWTPPYEHYHMERLMM